MDRFKKLAPFIVAKISKEVASSYYYHNLAHTLDVVQCVKSIGEKEKVTPLELELLSVAALLHDIGFINGPVDHEMRGSNYAQVILPSYSFKVDEIQIIANLILSTKYPPQPKSLLEKIICDADLDYLGRTDFETISANLFKELKNANANLSVEEWNRIQVNFLTNHQYFTTTSLTLRSKTKIEHLTKLRLLIGEE